MRLGTRGSALALAQARAAAAAIGGPEDVEIVPITSSGDRDRAAPDKAKWVRELERALLDGEIDFAVHSAKDVPSAMPEGLALVGALVREDPRDALCGTLSGRVGTSSPRRAAQLRAMAPEVEVVEVRGNVDTRLAKLAAGELDGLVLALAGLRRLGREEAVSALLDDQVPAAGQGIVVLQGRTGSGLALPHGDASRMAARTGSGLAVPHVDPPRDPRAWTALLAERALVRALRADCDTAVGAHHDGTTLKAWVGAEDGSQWILDEQPVTAAPDPESLGELVAHRLLAAGAEAVLRG